MKSHFMLFLVLFFASVIWQNSNAQIDVKQKAKDKTIERADRVTDEVIDEGLDAVEEGVRDALKKKSDPEEETEMEDQSDNATDEESVAAESQSKTKQASAQPGLQSTTKYDFVPGDKVLLYEDFSQDEVGDFPALWTTNGSGEVRTLNLYPGNWFYLNTADATYCLMKDLKLPANYILEFDVVPTSQEEDGSDCSFTLTLYESSEGFMNEDIFPGDACCHITLNCMEWQVAGYADGDYTVTGNTEKAPLDIKKLNHVIIWIQKKRLRIYHKGEKVVDLPTVISDQHKFNRLRLSLWSQAGFPYITDIRFTTAAPDMRSKLLTEGKIVSYGIYFDVNSDKVKPESNGALTEIAKVLKENPDVRVKIVGHTDSDGDDAKNLDLSKRRAASVKSELTRTYGIDASRLETDGKGESQPIAPNDTPANKAQNRRVEFIKL